MYRQRKLCQGEQITLLFSCYKNKIINSNNCVQPPRKHRYIVLRKIVLKHAGAAQRPGAHNAMALTALQSAATITELWWEKSHKNTNCISLPTTRNNPYQRSFIPCHSHSDCEWKTTEIEQWKPRKNKLRDVTSLSKAALSQVWDCPIMCARSRASEPDGALAKACRITQLGAEWGVQGHNAGAAGRGRREALSGHWNAKTLQAMLCFNHSSP